MHKLDQFTTVVGMDMDSLIQFNACVSLNRTAGKFDQAF